MTTTIVDDGGDLALHMAARTVAGRCPAPLNALEVAVVLETCGYTTTRAVTLGADGLLDLGTKVLGLMPLYASPTSLAEPAPVEDRRDTNAVADFARGLVYSSPWLLSIVTTIVAGVSFWSSNVAIPSVANAVTLATAVSLLVTAPFIQAFGRRASFYRGLGDQGMIVWITRWTLELGLVVTAASCLVFYLVRNVVLHAGTPATGRLGLAAGLAIAGLQVGLASFYVRGAFLSMGVIMVGGASVLVWHVEHAGAYLNPVALIVWQLRLVAVMAAVCWVMSAWWLLPRPIVGAESAVASVGEGCRAIGHAVCRLRPGILRHRGDSAARERWIARRSVQLQSGVHPDERGGAHGSGPPAGSDRGHNRAHAPPSVSGIAAALQGG